MAMLNDSDDDDEGSLALIIDDIDRYKNMIINKYSKFLDKAYIRSLLKKVTVIEKNFQDKLDELVEEKTHYRSR